MNTNFNNDWASVVINCSSCNRKHLETIGRLKSGDYFCPSCGKKFESEEVRQMIGITEQDLQASKQFLEQVSSESGKRMKFIGPAIAVTALIVIWSTQKGHKFDLRAIIVLCSLAAFCVVLCITFWLRLDLKKFNREGKIASKEPRPERELPKEVEGGIPCVFCNKLIAHDAKICPFCDYTQPK